MAKPRAMLIALGRFTPYRAAHLRHQDTPRRNNMTNKDNMFSKLFATTILAVLLTGCATNQSTFSPIAKTLSCNAEAVTFSVPNDWQVDSKKCILSGPSNVQIFYATSSNNKDGAPPLLRTTSVIVATVIRHKLGLSEYGEATDISFHDSQGIQRTLKDANGRHVTLWVVQQQGVTGQIWLISPTDIWQANKDALTAIMQSVKVKKATE